MNPQPVDGKGCGHSVRTAQYGGGPEFLGVSLRLPRSMQMNQKIVAAPEGSLSIILMVCKANYSVSYFNVFP